MGEVLAAIEPYLIETNTPFKHIRNSDVLDRLNAGLSGYSQIGKSIVIYAENHPREVMRQLKALTAPFRGTGPMIPFARSIGGGLPLSYRFGAYRGSTLRRRNGSRARDRRDSRELAVPPDQIDIFADLIVPGEPDAEADTFLERFPVFRTIAQSGKSGVFLALDMRDPALPSVVVKLGYKNGAVSRFSDDGRTHVRREIDNYLMIQGGPLARHCPRLVSHLASHDASILVTSHIQGIDLAEAAARGWLRVEHVTAAWRIIEVFHAAGFVFTDPKLANFILDIDQDEVFAIDLEMLRPAERRDARLKRTFAVTLPSRPTDQSVDKAHFIASVFFSHDRRLGDGMGVVSLDDLRTAIDLSADRAISEWAGSRLKEVLGAATSQIATPSGTR